MRPSQPAAGQSSLEYVGVLTLVGALIAAAGPVVGLPPVGAQVAHAVRTGICIVGGDVCRAADARAAGLAPCTLSDRRKGGGAAVTVLSVKFGERHAWTIAQRSDGSVVVTRDDDDEAGLSAGLGLEAGPLRIGADAGLSFTVAGGMAWELPDAAAARRFLADVEHGRLDVERWPPTWRFGDAGAAAEAEAEAGLGVGLGGKNGVDVGVGGVEASAEAAMGVRVGRGQTTLYLRTATEGPGLSDPLGHAVGRGQSGPVVVEYTRDRSGPRELAFRGVAAGARAGEIVEIVARLDLRDAANRAIAGRLLRVRAPWPPSIREDLRAVIRHTVAVGTVERSVYSVSDDSYELSLAGRLGFELGLELERTRVARRLVGATAWTAGSDERRREDCLA